MEAKERAKEELKEKVEREKEEAKLAEKKKWQTARNERTAQQIRDDKDG